MSWLAALVAGLKGVSAARDLINRFTELWITYEDDQDQTAANKRIRRRNALVSALSQPGMSNAERDEIRRALWDLQSSVVRK